MRGIYPVFLLSGFAALVYQVVWQRALFEIYGLNSESVAMVVTVFLLGLGVGSLAGGALSRDPGRRVLLLFALIELGIGLFGFVSLPLIRTVGSWTLRLSPLGTSLVAFALMLAPTTLMGATLPLLVAHRVRASANVGASVAALYAVNTLGSALASLVAALWLLGTLGQANSTRLAAVVNVTVALAVLAQHRRTRCA